MNTWGVFPEVCKWIIHGGNGESKSAFKYAQDSAPVETDTSGGYGLAEVQRRQCAAFFIADRSSKAALYESA